MTSLSIAPSLDPAKLSRLADRLVVAVAVSLPWSTSITGILLVMWLLAVIPTLDWAGLRHEISKPTGGLPILLVLLGFIGMLWADVTWLERWGGVESFLKLLVIPLLLVQFRRSEGAYEVFGGYTLSCVVLLLWSCMLALWPNAPLHFSLDYGVPVKNAATQSGEFVTCIFALAYLVYDAVIARRWSWAVGILTVILAMLANIAFVATGRTALVVLLVLLALFAVKKLSLRGTVLLFAAAVALSALAWSSSSYLRWRTETLWTDFQKYEATDDRNSSGERAEFYKKSIGFIREAPFIGHGTGTIHSLFIQSSIGQTGAKGSATTNPHNQTFAVAIQLGLVGAIVLWAMWIAHLTLFRGSGFVEWIGLVIVMQNIVGSLFNSHLFDFLQGWVYVIGVGVAGGVALKNRAKIISPVTFQ